MNQPIRVARVDEIPPGAGKTVELERCTVVVYNAEGRMFARVEHRNHRGGDSLAPRRCAPTCLPHGHRFSVTVEDSPARVASNRRDLVPRIDGDYVVLMLDEAA